MPWGNISASRDSYSQPAARRKRSKTLWALLVLAATSSVGVVVLVVALGTLIVFTPSEEAATRLSAGLVVDIRAVAAQIDDYTPDASRETILPASLPRSLDGHRLHLLPRGRDDLYVKCTLTVERPPPRPRLLPAGFGG